MSNSNKYKINITEGLILASVPLLGYAIAYAYESGFANYFGIPTFLISITLTQILTATAALIGISISLLLYLNLPYILLHKTLDKPNRIKSFFLRMIPVFLILAALIFIYGTYWKEWIFLLIILFIIMFFEFIFPLITQHKTKGYVAKLKAQDEVESKVNTIYEAIKDKIGTTPFFAIWYLLVILFLAYNMGRATALKKVTFLIYTKKTNFAVLTSYNDTLISRKYDETTKYLEGEFYLQKISNVKPIKLMEKAIGPLKNKKTLI